MWTTKQKNMETEWEKIWGLHQNILEIVLGSSVSLKSATFLPLGSMMTTAVSIMHSLFSIQEVSVTSNQEKP